VRPDTDTDGDADDRNRTAGERLLLNTRPASPWR